MVQIQDYSLGQASLEAVAPGEAGNEKNDEHHHQDEHSQEYLYFHVIPPHFPPKLPASCLELIGLQCNTI